MQNQGRVLDQIRSDVALTTHTWQKLGAPMDTISYFPPAVERVLDQIRSDQIWHSPRTLGRSWGPPGSPGCGHEASAPRWSTLPGLWLRKHVTTLDAAFAHGSVATWLCVQDVHIKSCDVRLPFLFSLTLPGLRLQETPAAAACPAAQLPAAPAHSPTIAWCWATWETRAAQQVLAHTAVLMMSTAPQTKHVYGRRATGLSMDRAVVSAVAVCCSSAVLQGVCSGCILVMQDAAAAMCSGPYS